MNIKFLAALAVAATMSAPLQANTVYTTTYEGWTVNAHIVGNSPFQFVNPNEAEDIAKFGTGLTGSMTFNFDTTGVSGRYQLGICLNGDTPGFTCDAGGKGLISDIHFETIGGQLSVIGQLAGINFVELSDGNITNWLLRGIDGGCPFDGNHFCVWESMGNGVGGGSMRVQQNCLNCYAVSGITGVVWTAAVPLPAIGTGLPALIIGGVALWLRRKLAKVRT